MRDALVSAVPPPRKQYPPRAAPVLDEWKPVIDRWLLEDREAPVKQRHTARRVWQRLVSEHGAVVGESTVRRYVAAAKRDLPAVIAEVKVHIRIITPRSTNLLEQLHTTPLCHEPTVHQEATTHRPTIKWGQNS